MRLQTLQGEMLRTASARITRERHRLELLSQRLHDASPERLLARGYSLTLKEGKVVKDAAQLRPGDEIQTRLAQGEVRSIVR